MLSLFRGHRPHKVEIVLPDGAVISRAGAADIADIYALEVSCFSSPWPLEVLYEDICVNHNIYFVVRKEDKAIAYAGMCLILDEAHINNVCVLEEYRRAGYGKELLKCLSDNALRSGADSMTLEVRASNKAAIKLYEGFGFKIEGCRRKYYVDNGEDAYIMWKQGLKIETAKLVEVGG